MHVVEQLNSRQFPSLTRKGMSKQHSGVIVGQKGVQYGLQKVVPKKSGAQPASAPRKVAPANVFGNDDSEEEDVERQIARQADKKRAAAKVGRGVGINLWETRSVTQPLKLLNPGRNASSSGHTHCNNGADHVGRKRCEDARAEERGGSLFSSLFHRPNSPDSAHPSQRACIVHSVPDHLCCHPNAAMSIPNLHLWTPSCFHARARAWHSSVTS